MSFTHICIVNRYVASLNKSPYKLAVFSSQSRHANALILLLIIFAIDRLSFFKIANEYYMTPIIKFGCRNLPSRLLPFR